MILRYCGFQKIFSTRLLKLSKYWPSVSQWCITQWCASNSTFAKISLLPSHCVEQEPKQILEISCINRMTERLVTRCHKILPEDKSSTLRLEKDFRKQFASRKCFSREWFVDKMFQVCFHEQVKKKREEDYTAQWIFVNLVKISRWTRVFFSWKLRQMIFLNWFSLKFALKLHFWCTKRS